MANNNRQDMINRQVIIDDELYTIVIDVMGVGYKATMERTGELLFISNLEVERGLIK